MQPFTLLSLLIVLFAYLFALTCYRPSVCPYKMHSRGTSFFFFECSFHSICETQLNALNMKSAQKIIDQLIECKQFTKMYIVRVSNIFLLLAHSFASDIIFPLVKIWKKKFNIELKLLPFTCLHTYSLCKPSRFAFLHFFCQFHLLPIQYIESASVQLYARKIDQCADIKFEIWIAHRL